jgi:ABC-type transport system involved in multi-copper enzyme maturation permease subunit
MKNPVHTPFVAVFQNEVLLNSKRVAPYFLMVLFSANAVLWWGWGPAVKLGWATNSDWYIARGLLAFSFLLGLPIFNAVIMGDSVIRDFRLGIDPLIFSKPINRAQYLLGKFFGNFFVLVCCQAAFPVTQLVLQAFPTSQMIVLPFRVFPYFKHFFFLLVITHLVLAAFYFTVGTLTRNSKIVYGLAACFYPLIITYGLFFLRPLPFRWQVMLDPMLLGASLKGNGFLHSAEFLNQYVVRYTADMIANRLVMILVAAVCLAILYLRFTIAERPKVEKLSVLSLSTAAERVYYDLDSLSETRGRQLNEFDSAQIERAHVLPLPDVAQANEGMRANLNKLIAALGTEFRLLLSERSLVVIIPLAVLISTLEIVFWNVTPDPSYSAAYAANTARLLLLFMLGITVFYTGEALHRDRDLRIEPLLWSQAGPNYVLLLSKFLATLLLTLTLILLVALITITVQALKQHAPVELVTYIRIYGLIVIPNAVFLAAAALALGVLLRDRYVTYAVAIGTCAGLFYLYSQGYNGWLYNPMLYQLWTYPDLIGGRNYSHIIWHRVYVLALAAFFIGLAHFFYPRKSGTTARVR